MSWRSIDVVGQLNRLLAEGAISEGALEAMTQIDTPRLRAALIDGQTAAGILTSEESQRLSTLAAQLTEGMTVDDDERLKAIIESLIGELHLSVSNLARLTGVDEDEVDNALLDPATVPAETKYTLALRSSYLLNSGNLARRT